MSERCLCHSHIQVDSFNHSDHMLNSALGRSDGRVYEALYELVKQDPLTRHPPMSPFKAHL